MKKFCVVLAVCLTLFCLPHFGLAGDYPARDITLVVPFDAGGTADIPARIVARYMSKYSAKPVVVVNMPGAGGSIGAREVMKAKPDGYTIMHVAAGVPMQYAIGTVNISLNNRPFDLVYTFGFIMLGYAFEQNKYPIAPMVLGLILGPMIEESLRRSISYYGSFWECITMWSVGSILFYLAILFPAFVVYKGIKAHRAETTREAVVE